jgi:hypothetical protein
MLAHMALPLGEAGMRTMPNEDTVRSVLQKNIPEKGLYLFPAYNMREEHSELDDARWAQKYRTGPAGLLVYAPIGGEINMPVLLLGEFASNILAAAVAALVALLLTGGYWKRVLALSALGLFAWLSVNVSYWNWYGFPPAFVLAEGLDTLVGAFLSGLVIAKILPPAKQA